MDLTSAVLALLSSLFYGGGDFALALASRANTVFGTSCAFQVLGLPVLGVALAISHPPVPSPAAAADGLFGGACLGIGGVAFVAALAKGPMGVIAPLTAVGAAGVPVLVGVGHGDRVTPLAAAGLVLAVAGLVLVTRDRASSLAARGVPEGVLAALGFGGYFVFLSAGESGGWWTVSISRLVVAVGTLAVAGLSHRTMTVARRSVPTVVIAATLAAGAAATFIFAQRGGSLTLTSVLASMYPAVTVLLAGLLLKERLRRVQQAGMVLSLVAVVLISTG